ncbi:MAG: hypothetical protein ACREJO_16980 [Phycisphaerales bacterium]
MKHHTPAVIHPSHDRLLKLKLQGAEHLAKVLETHPSDAMRLKAALALARLAIPAVSTRPAASEPHDTASPSLREGEGVRADDQPEPVALPTPVSSSAREGAGGRASDQPEHVVSPNAGSHSPREAVGSSAIEQSSASPTPSRPASPPGRTATPLIPQSHPRSALFSAPAKPLATACFERLGMKFP